MALLEYTGVPGDAARPAGEVMMLMVDAHGGGCCDFVLEANHGLDHFRCCSVQIIDGKRDARRRRCEREVGQVRENLDGCTGGDTVAVGCHERESQSICTVAVLCVLREWRRLGIGGAGVSVIP